MQATVYPRYTWFEKLIICVYYVLIELPERGIMRMMEKGGDVLGRIRLDVLDD
ncbi:MAG: hypothetical protein ACE14T_04900 [Syntrophales bacterium]